MICPYCKINLKKIPLSADIKDKFAYVCPKCSGILLEMGGLREYLQELASSDNISHDNSKILEPREVVKNLSSSKKLVCPKCQNRMHPLNYSYNSNIILDKCSLCDGIWVEQKEVKDLATFNKSNTITENLFRAKYKDEQKMRREIKSVEHILGKIKQFFRNGT